MCGLVGIAGNLTTKDEATMKRLLLFDYFRGTDSTGLAAVRKNADVIISKMASHPIDLFGTKKFDVALSGYSSLVFLGHNRAATKGKVNGANAHPWQYGHIIGAHNGTLDKSSWDALNELLDEPTDVDSQAIFACIEKVGIEETTKLLQGAWALTWIDLKEGTLNFLRNSGRPLWYAYAEDFKQVFWASEWPMMDAALDMSRTDYDIYEDKEGNRFWSVKENWLYRFDIEALQKGAKSIPKPRVKELKGKEVVKVPHSQQDYFKRTPTFTSTSKQTKSNVVEFNAYAEAPFGNLLDKEDFEECAKYGCSWCSADVSYADEGITVYEHQKSVLCSDCTTGQDTRVHAHKKSKAFN